MSAWVRRIRGAVGMGLTWAGAWFGLWASIGIVSLVVNGGAAVDALLDTVMFPLAGFVAGTTFSVVLSVAERRHRFDQVSIPRFAGWGAVGGLLMFGLAGGAGAGIYGVVVNGSIMALLCSASAAGSLMLARRADDHELLEAGEEAAAVGLTEEERHHLLGA